MSSREVNILRAEIDGLTVEILELKAEVATLKSELNSLRAGLDEKIQATILRAQSEAMKLQPARENESIASTPEPTDEPKDE